MNRTLRQEEMERDESNARKSSNPERELIKKFYTQFNRAEQKVSGKHKKWRIIDLFDRSEQWFDADIPPWVPKPVHNMIRYIRILKRSNLASAIPAAHYSPLDLDDKDLVEMIQFGYRHVWDTEKVPRIVRRCIDRSILQGTGIAMVYDDDSFIDGKYYGEFHPKNKMYQGAVKVKRIPVSRFFPDPDAHRLDDCSFVEVTEDTTVKAVKKNKLFRAYAGDKLDRLRTNTGGESDSETGEIFDRDHNPHHSLAESETEQRVVLHARWEYEYKEDGTAILNRYYYIPGNDFLLHKQEDVRPSRFPFAVLYDEEEENDFWGSATAWDIFEKQKLINKTEQSTSIIATMYQNPQKVVFRDSGINGQDMAKKGTLPGKVWVSNIDPSRAVHVIQPPDIPKGLFETKDRNVADIKDYVGINEAYSGESIGSLTTSTGVNSLIERATIRDKDKMKQIDDFVEQISNLIVMFIIEKWKEKRPMVNYGPAGKVSHREWEPITESDAENLRWIARSDVYATAPTTQALKKQQADQLLQYQLQFQPDPAVITTEEWLHFQDFDIKDQILERMESDRKKKQQREAQDFASLAVQLSQQASQLIAQGVPPEKVTEMLKGQAKEILEGKAQKEAQSGLDDSRPKDAAKPPEAPKGDTGQMAMMAQAKGM